MGKLFKGKCLQCKKRYKGRGKSFCSNSCRVTWTNLHRNVAKRKDVREKMSKIAKQTNRQNQLMTPEARQKAVRGISLANRGKRHSKKWNVAIGMGVKRSGVKPPRNPHLVGPNHWHWQGGTSTIRNRDFKKPEYIAFRNAVLKRDDFTCQKCGEKGGRLHAHHIKAWASYPELRYDISNGLTVCKKPCHYTIHRNTPRPLTVGPRILSDLL